MIWEQAGEPGLALVILARPGNIPRVSDWVVPRLVEGKRIPMTMAPKWLTHGPHVSSAKAFSASNVEMKAGLPLNNQNNARTRNTLG